METSGKIEIPKKSSKKSLLFFIGSFLAALLLTWLVKEPGFTDSQVYVLFLLFFAIGLWLTEAIPAFAVGLFIMAYLVFAIGNKYFNSAPGPIDQYVNTFSSSVIWLMLGSFFLSSAMTKTQLDVMLLKMTLKISGTNPRKILLAIMVLAMVTSMVMSNAATTAMMLAAIMPLLVTLGKSNLSKALLLGIAVAATTGGMTTIIGNPPNALAAGMIEKSGIEFGFIDWMYYGIPLTIILTILTYFVLVKTYMKTSEPVSFGFMSEETTKASPEARIPRMIVGGVILVTVLFWLTGSIHGISVAAISAIPLVVLSVTGILTGKEVRALPWDTLFLVAGGLSLGVALQNTGIMDHFASKIKMLEASPLVLALILAYITMLITGIMSDTATGTIFIPMAMAILPEHKDQIAVIIGLSASTAVFLPVSTASNSIVYSTGYLEQKDFRVVAAIIGLLGPILAILWVTLIN